MGFIPPTALLTTISSAPSSLKTRTGRVTCLRAYPSYMWKRPSIATTAAPSSVPQTSRPACPVAVEERKCGISP